MFLKSSQFSQESICVGVFFSKVEDPQNCNVNKERLQHRFIREHLFCRGSMNGWFWKTNAPFQKQLFLQNISSGCFWQFQISIMQLYSKGDWSKDVYLWNLQIFWEHILTEHHLWILRSFSDHLFYKAPFRNCLFHLQVAEFQPPHTGKKYFTSAFQAFYTRRKSCSKAFMYLKSLKSICEEVKL